MFDRSTHLAAAAFGLLVAANGAAAQSARDYERRVDSLAAIAARTSAELAQYKLARNARESFHDTVRVGVLRILTTPTLAPLVRTAAEAALRRIEARVGRAAAPLGDALLFARREGTNNAKDSASILMGVEQSNGDEVLRGWYGGTAAEIENGLFNLGMRQLAATLDPVYHEWAGGNALPMDTMSALGWSEVRLQMVSSPAFVVRDCYAGDLRACARVVHLSPSTDPLTTWYNATDRRRLVLLEASRRGLFWSVGVSRCGAGNDSDCVSVLRGLNLGCWCDGVGQPSLIRQALAMGGPGAMERLMLSRGTPAEDLAAAAGVSADSVLRAWQRNVHDTRVPSDDMSSGIALMSAAWIAVFAGLSLRSPRWR